MREKVSVKCALVIVNFGSHQLIDQNLRAVAARTDDLRIIVVDNFSTGQERSDIQRVCQGRGWHLVESPTNLGFGAGVNLGVSHAMVFEPETIILLNPDAILDPEVMDGLCSLVAEKPNRLICPRITDTRGAIFFAGSVLDMETGATLGHGSKKRRPEGVYREWFTGACLAFAPSLWERIGGFDNDYFLYWEDIDFSFRAVQAGAELYYAEHLTVIHDEGGTQQTQNGRAKSGTYYYYNVRNRMLFARKWLPTESRQSWNRVGIGSSWEIVMRGGRRQLLQSMTPWISLFRGMFDGWRDARGVQR